MCFPRFFTIQPCHLAPVPEQLCFAFVTPFSLQVYSYVFGDGDPNVNVNERAVAAAASAIRAAGGVVTAAQLAPFVPEPPLRKSTGNVVS